MKFKVMWYGGMTMKERKPTLICLILLFSVAFFPSNVIAEGDDIVIESNMTWTDDLSVSLNGQTQTIKATFIRAPKISRVGLSVEIISSYDGEPVAVKQSHHLGLAFHPELESVTLFHEFIFKTQFETIHAA